MLSWFGSLVLVVCCAVFCCDCYGDRRDLHVLTYSFPTRRSSDLLWDSRKLWPPRVLCSSIRTTRGLRHFQQSGSRSRRNPTSPSSSTRAQTAKSRCLGSSRKFCASSRPSERCHG